MRIHYELRIFRPELYDRVYLKEYYQFGVGHWSCRNYFNTNFTDSVFCFGVGVGDLAKLFSCDHTSKNLNF